MAAPMMIAAAAVQAVGAISQGNAAGDAADADARGMEYNAAGDRARATQAGRMASIQEDAQRRQARATIGEQLAGSAAAGAGVNSDLLRQSIFDSESDSRAIRYEGEIKRAGLNDQATMGMYNASNRRAQGDAARTSGYLNAAGSLLSAGSKYYGGGSKLTDSTKIPMQPGGGY